MSPIMKKLWMVLAMLAVLGYTVWNYAMVKTTLTYFLVFVAVLGYPLVNVGLSLIEDLKNRE